MATLLPEENTPDAADDEQLYCEHCGAAVYEDGPCAMCGRNPATGEPYETDVVKTCACGYRITEARWDAMPTPPSGGEHFNAEHHEVLSCRDCACGSTLLRVHCSVCGAETDGHPHACGDDTDTRVAMLLTAFVMGRGVAFDRILETANTEI